MRTTGKRSIVLYILMFAFMLGMGFLTYKVYDGGENWVSYGYNGHIYAEDAVVSLGDIKISTNKEQILFYDKSFKVTNTSIEGSITYGANASSQVGMPKDSFVVLQRISDGARIGSFTIDSNGHYLLRLRNEYEINWDLDEYRIEYADPTGTGAVYTTENTITLPNLMANPNIRLILSE